MERSLKTGLSLLGTVLPHSSQPPPGPRFSHSPMGGSMDSQFRAFSSRCLATSSAGARRRLAQIFCSQLSPQVPWAQTPETGLGLSAFSPLHFVLSLISLSCISGPHMTPTLVRVFHPHPRSSSLAPRGPHLPACRSAPHELLWANPAYFPS